MEADMSKETNNRLEALANVGDEKKKIWRRVGVAFPLKNREGFSLKLELIPVPSSGAYEFILVKPSEKEAAE